MYNYTIRPVTENDYDFVLRVNEENVEVLAPMDRAGLQDFVKISSLFYIAEVEGRPAAFLIALTKEADSYEIE